MSPAHNTHLKSINIVPSRKWGLRGEQWVGQLKVFLAKGIFLTHS